MRDLPVNGSPANDFSGNDGVRVAPDPLYQRAGQGVLAGRVLGDSVMTDKILHKTVKNYPRKGAWQAPSFLGGTVWLVGAGPGDPGLVTRLADYALGRADIVFYDALLDMAILDQTRGDARCCDVGKRAGKSCPSQDAISRMLVDAARENKRVVRLKGGDPFVFGRGGEEALALCHAQIPFRIVPGVTSGTAALAYAGIPLTHRGLAQSAAFVTGHDASGRLPDTIDWGALCRGVAVLVFFMAAAKAGSLARRLIAHGRDKSEEMALISKACCPDQKVVVQSLAKVAQSDTRVDTPALIVVGPVVALRPAIDWFGPSARG